MPCYIFAELAEVQFRLAGPVVGLDEDPARPAVGNDALQACLERGAAAEDDDGGDLAGGLHAVV